MKNKKKLLALVCIALVACIAASVAVVAYAGTQNNSGDTTICYSTKANVNGAIVSWPAYEFTMGTARTATVEQDDPYYVNFLEDASENNYPYTGYAPLIGLKDAQTNNLMASSTVYLTYACPEIAGGVTTFRNVNLNGQESTPLWFRISTSYDTKGSLHILKVNYENLGFVLRGGSSETTDPCVIQLTPVVKRLVSYSASEYVQREGESNTASASAKMNYEVVETLSLMREASYDKYYTTFTYEDGELEAGIYNISFILSYTDKYGNRIALDVDDMPTGEADAVSKQIDNSQFIGNNSFKVYARHFNGAFLTTNDTSSPVYNIRTTSPFIVGLESAATGTGTDSPYFLYFPSYEYGSFDPEEVLYIETIDKQLFDTRADKNGVLSADAICYRLYRVYEDGTRQNVYDTGDTSPLYPNDTYFQDSAVFNDLTIGKYEIEVAFKGEESGVDFVRATFTVTPKTIDETSTDIYAIIANYYNDGDVTAASYEKNMAILADALAYYKAYRAADAAHKADEAQPDAEALYGTLSTEYNKVMAAYDVAYTAYNGVCSFVGNKLSRYLWYKDAVPADDGYLVLATNNLLESYADVLVSSSKDPLADPFDGSLLSIAYEKYCDYVEAYNDYVTFCANLGITVTPIGDCRTAYAEFVGQIKNHSAYYNDFDLSKEDFLQALENDHVSAILPYEPAIPGGLIKADALEKDYDGMGQYPNLILAQYTPHSRIESNLRPLQSLEALSSTTSVSRPFGKKVSRISSADTLFDYGKANYIYVAYSVKNAAGTKDVTSVAVHSGTYPITLAFEGNYQGNVSGFDFTIGKFVITVSEDTDGVTKTYDKQAYDPLTEFGWLDLTRSATYELSNPDMGIKKSAINADPYNYATYYGVSSQYSSFRGFSNYVDPMAALKCTVEKKNADSTYTAVEAAVDAGFYRLCYTLSDSAKNDFRLVNDEGKEVTVLYVDLEIKREHLTVNFNVSGVEFGDTLADVLAKINYQTVNGAPGAFADLVSVDFENAGLLDASVTDATVFLPAGTKVVADAANPYELYIPVSLVDTVNYKFDGTTEVGGKDYVVVTVPVDKKTVTVDWSESVFADAEKAFAGVYNGASHLAEMKAFFTDVNGVKQYLTVTSDVDPVHAGAYRIGLVLPAALTTDYRLPESCEKTYTVAPLTVTAAVKDLDETMTGIIYSDDALSFLYSKFDLVFNGALTDDVDMAVTAEGVPETARFSYEMNVAALTVNGSYYNFELDDYDKIPAGTYKVVFSVASKTVDYVLAEDEVVASLVVEPRDLTENDVDFNNAEAFVFDGEEQKLTFTIIDELLEKTLKEERDYTLTYTDNVHAGTAKVTVTYVGNYKGTKSATFEISKRPVTLSAENGVPENAVYTGSALTPDLTIEVDGLTLRAEDFAVTYSDNVNVGTGTAHVSETEDGDFTFETYDVNFSVLPKEMTEHDITVASVPYTGSAVTPAPVVKDGAKVLAAGTDYTVSYENNVEVGTATVIVTYIGNYTGVGRQTFTVKSLVVDNSDKSKDPTKEETKANVVIEYEDGFEKDIEVQVQVVASAQMKDKEVSASLLINYKEELGRKEAISQIYEVKLVQVDESGNVVKEISVSDLKDGATIVVKMAIPEDILNGGKLIRVIHVHAADDVTTLEPASEGTTSAELKVGEYLIDGDFLVTRIDRLSEFAFVTEKDCSLHWFLLGELVVFLTLAVLAWFVWKKRTIDLFVKILCAAFAVAYIVTAVFSYCVFCLVLVILCSLALIGVVAVFLPITKYLPGGDDTDSDEEPEETVEEPELTQEEKEENELRETYEKLASLAPAPVSFEGEGKVEVIGVCLAGRKKIYRFAPNGMTYAQGDRIIADTVNGKIRGIVVHANYFVDPKDLAAGLKNVSPKNDAE